MPSNNTLNIISLLRAHGCKRLRLRTSESTLPYRFYLVNTALMRRMPCATASSFTILKGPSSDSDLLGKSDSLDSSPVCSTCGPPQNSIEYAESSGPTE